MTPKRPWLSTLGFVGFFINSAIAKGHGKAVSFEEIYDSLERGTLLEDLDRKIPDTFDFSLFPPGGDQSVGLNETLDEVAGGLRDRERKKIGIEESGLHLLLAFIIEAMQQEYWEVPPRR